MPEGTESTWYLLRDGAQSAATNMAIDETLLLSCAAMGGPVLRFYGWSESAASFGYFQRYAEVERMTALRPLVRRPTGGGLVPHDADWTYSLCFPPAHAWYALKAVESYQRLHQWVQRAFGQCGVGVDLAAASSKTMPGQCFAGPEQFDIVWKGRKLAGAAQRRTRNGLLIQGSVQPPPHAERQQWQQAMCGVATNNWGVRWHPLELSPQLLRMAGGLEEEKFRTVEFQQRR